jgi:hypothetical protein
VTTIQVSPLNPFRVEGGNGLKLMPGGTGCGIVSPSDTSFGEPFNAAGGGVFGMLWDGTGIRMCKSAFVILFHLIPLLTTS